MTVNIRKCKKEQTQQICWKVQGFQSSLWTGRNIKLFQTFREDRLASHFFSDVFPLKEFTTMGLMYLLEVPSLEEILNLGIHQIAAVLEQIPFPLYCICWRPCYVDSDCMRWEVGGGGGEGWEFEKTRKHELFMRIWRCVRKSSSKWRLYQVFRHYLQSWTIEFLCNFCSTCSLFHRINLRLNCYWSLSNTERLLQER